MLMDLYIETLTGVSFELRVSPAETVMSIKSKIQRAEGIPVTQQHLIWQNGELDDHRRLRDYSISGGSTIRLVLGLCGGPLNTHRIPPLRLTPLHIPTTMPSVLSRLRRNSSSNRAAVQQSSSGLTLANSIAILPNLASRPTHSGCSSSRPRSTQKISRGVIETTTIPSCTAPTVEEACDPSLASADKECAKGVASSPLAGELSACESSTCTTQEKPDSGPQACSNANSHEQHSDGETPARNRLENSAVSPESSTLNRTDSCGIPVSRGNPDDTSSTCLGYPPLFPDGRSRLPANRYDWSSFWRLYEPHALSTLSRALLVRNSYQLVGTSDRENDSSAPGSAGEQETPLDEARKHDRNKTVGRKNPDKNVSLPGPINPSSTTMLAGLLSTTGDQLNVPCQAGGGESFLDHDRHVYDELHKVSPLLEELEFARQNRIAALLWNPGDLTADSDRLVDNPFDVDTEQDEDDDDDDDDDDPDEDEVESVETKGGYGFDDDDDSLADLEDYMLYYRTGDLLFGPPSLSAIYPYSYYTVFDTHSTDLDADFGLYAAPTAKEDPGTTPPWNQECTKMVEKVSELKSKMKELRLRRECRQRSKAAGVVGSEASAPATTSTDATQQSMSCPTTTTSPSRESPSRSLPRSSSQVPGLQDGLEGTTGCAKVACQTADTHGSSEQRPRRRRFGTVVPPDPTFFTHTDHSSSAGSPTAEVSNLKPKNKTGVNSAQHSATLPSLTAPSHQIRRPLSSSIRPKLHPHGLTNPQPPPFGSEHNKSLTSRQFSVLPRPWTSDASRVLKYSQEPRKAKVSPLPAILISSPAPPTDCPALSSCGPERRIALPHIACDESGSTAPPQSPPKTVRSPVSSARRKRCALCLRKTGLINSYICRCGRNFCSRHRYAETHSCPFDYKAEARRTLIEANPVVTAPKLPKI